MFFTIKATRTLLDRLGSELIYLKACVELFKFESTEVPKCVSLTSILLFMSILKTKISKYKLTPESMRIALQYKDKNKYYQRVAKSKGDIFIE